LKEDLLQQYTLTKYQRIKRLLAVSLLGGRRPSQLLAEMMELCPDDEEASCFFVFFVLQCLPAWLRVQLEGDDQDDIRRLATRADPLFALHGHKHGRSVAVVEGQEDEDEAANINAVQGGSPVEGRAFTIYTDHTPFTRAINRSSEPWMARHCGQLAYVAEYASDTAI
jgi:hypothetical protein